VECFFKFIENFLASAIRNRTRQAVNLGTPMHADWQSAAFSDISSCRSNFALAFRNRRMQATHQSRINHASRSSTHQSRIKVNHTSAIHQPHINHPSATHTPATGPIENRPRRPDPADEFNIPKAAICERRCRGHCRFVVGVGDA
jgi:hypothetical protein